MSWFAGSGDNTAPDAEAVTRAMDKATRLSEMAKAARMKQRDEFAQLVQQPAAQIDALTEGEDEIAQLIAQRRDPAAGARAQGVAQMLGAQLPAHQYHQYVNNYAEKVRTYLAAVGTDNMNTVFTDYDDAAKTMEKRYADALQLLS
jgi:hypothetical protein